MKLRSLFDAIGVLAAAAVVADQAIELLAPYAKHVNASRFVPDVIRDIPTRTANAFSAFTTQPTDYHQSPRVVRSGPTQPRQHRAPPMRARPANGASGRIAQTA
jgi:hypothetical protein